jgi:hypothetical protein
MLMNAESLYDEVGNSHGDTLQRAAARRRYATL